METRLGELPCSCGQGMLKMRGDLSMRVYLDNCCFNRPFDDQSQARVRLEAEAKLEIQQQITDKRIELAWSYVLEHENHAVHLKYDATWLLVGGAKQRSTLKRRRPSCCKPTRSPLGACELPTPCTFHAPLRRLVISF